MDFDVVVAEEMETIPKTINDIVQSEEGGHNDHPKISAGAESADEDERKDYEVCVR